MWTYQVRQRQFKLEEGQTLNFPNDVEILFIFSPTQPFGAGLDHGRTAVQNFAALGSTGLNHSNRLSN